MPAASAPAPKARVSHRKNTPRQPLQERGRARYEALLDTVEAMLTEAAPDEIGYYEIAERAGMPPGSVYHFFPTKSAIFLALAERYFEAFRKGSTRPLADEHLTSWQEAIEVRQAHAVDYYNAHPSAMRLILGAQPFLEIRAADSSTNVDISRLNLAELERAFHVPPVPDIERKMLICITIGDAIWRVSFTEHGKITPDYAREATRATIAYMRTFLPEFLSRRTPEDTEAEVSAATQP